MTSTAAPLFDLTIHDVTTRGVIVPMARPLATRIVVLEKAALLLIDLHTEEGVTGRTYLFGYLERGIAYMAALVRDIVAMTRGDKIAPQDLYAKVRKGLSLMGHEGLSTMAAAGFDMACWDALARAAGVPLVTLLGGSPRSLPAYNSNGLGLIEPAAAADEAQALIAEGNFKAVKMRLGRPTLEEDLAAVRAVREAVGDDILVPSDFNQGLTVIEAIRRGQVLDDEGLYWIEEPIVYDDLEGCAKIAAEVSTPIQLGENFYGPQGMARAIDAEAMDYVMPDVERIGGVTGWLRAAALAEAAGIEMSTHILPEVSSHLLAVTPTAHWLEYVDWAAPILSHPLHVADGQVAIPETPGSGIDWDEDAVKKYEVEV